MHSGMMRTVRCTGHLSCHAQSLRHACPPPHPPHIPPATHAPPPPPASKEGKITSGQIPSVFICQNENRNTNTRDKNGGEKFQTHEEARKCSLFFSQRERAIGRCKCELSVRTLSRLHCIKHL